MASQFGEFQSKLEPGPNTSYFNHWKWMDFCSSLHLSIHLGPSLSMKKGGLYGHWNYEKKGRLKLGEPGPDSACRVGEYNLQNMRVTSLTTLSLWLADDTQAHRERENHSLK